ncbi:MAG: hypothetical protein ALECFALPRED_007285 [Alectoria fallacina]|uniref:Uncharacterized protein n=1 Tax=Alectoria fallacina TaxID=1903189 RepID=A0A8H3G9Z9_9LECA|nr:MAG: hypothetical protein ALECFALPRED_007285 [Alectoria fallacina]
MTTIVKLPGMDVEIRYPRAKLPTHRGKELSIDDFRIFYTCIHHVKLSEEEFKGIIGVKLGMPGTWIPVTVTKLGNSDYPWTKEIAKLVEQREDWKQELLLRIAMLHDEWTTSVKKEKEEAAERAKLNLKYMRLPRLFIADNEKKTLSQDEVQEVYAGMCWYEFERKTLETHELKTLSRLLAGVKDIEQKGNFLPWLTKFIQGANDPFTVEVRRVATLNKESLLRKVDTVCQNHLYPNLLEGYQVAGMTRFQPSTSISGPGITESPAQGPAPTEPPVPPDIRPVPGSLSTVSHPQFQFSNPEEYEQDFIPDQLPQGFQNPSQYAGLYGQEAPIDRGHLAASETKTPISSSSGRSASPTRAETKRQEEDEKARRKTTKRGSEKKTDEDAGKKSGDRRQKKADKAKDQANKGHRPRP